MNERLALYRIRKSRGRKVPEEILTKDYSGIPITDFLSAYDKSGRKRQRSLVHLTSEMSECRETDSSEEYRAAYKKLKRIIEDAKRLNEVRGKIASWVCTRRALLLKKRCKMIEIEVFISSPFDKIENTLL